MTTEEDLGYIGDALDRARHYKVMTPPRSAICSSPIRTWSRPGLMGADAAGFSNRRPEGKSWRTMDAAPNAYFRSSAESVPDQLPGRPDMALRGRPLSDDHPQGEFSAQHRMRQVYLARRVQPVEKLPVEPVQRLGVAAVVQPEADQPEADRGHELEFRLRLDPALEEPGQADMLPDESLQALDAVRTDDEPELQRPEPPPELDAPVPIIFDIRIDAGLEVFGMDLERSKERPRVLDEIGRAVEIGQHPFVGIEDERIHEFRAVQHPAHLGQEGGRPGVSGVHVEPDAVAAGDLADRPQRIDRRGRCRPDRRHDAGRPKTPGLVFADGRLELFGDDGEFGVRGNEAEVFPPIAGDLDPFLDARVRFLARHRL